MLNTFLCTKILLLIRTYCFRVGFRHPMVTGTSVLGITFNGGVMIAADTLGMSKFCS